MKGYAIPSILIATVLLAGIFAFQPIEQASTVHTTITTNTDAEIDGKDQWISVTLNDIVGPTDGLDVDLSEDVADHINIAAGFLYIDETDAGEDAEVTLYCDEDANGTPAGGEEILKRSTDGFDVTLANNPSVAEACNFLRIDFAGYDATDTVDVYLRLQIDSTTG